MISELVIVLERREGRLVPHLTPPAEVPVARLLCGRAPQEAAELLPRVFSLCGAAQGQAARLAFGLPAQQTVSGEREIFRDHLAKLCLSWPGYLGVPPSALPEGWQAGGAALRDWLWGGAPPRDLRDWLGSGRGVAPVLAAIAAAFGPGEAVAEVAPLSDPFGRTAQDNAPAARQAGHPLMRRAEAVFGRGPLWRALGRVVDLDAAVQGALPPARVVAAGRATASAARGTYALEAAVTAGRVSALRRVTPTDHLCAPGGVLEATLASLPVAKAPLAPLVVDILDPCVPWKIKENADA